MGYIGSYLIRFVRSTQEIDNAKLEQQLIDIRRVHESALNEKMKVINKLNEDLSQCHSQYQTLAKSKIHDVTKIENELQQQNIENEVLKREITSLKVCQPFCVIIELRCI